METTLVNYQAGGFLLLGKEIMNPAYIVHVEDRGYVNAFKGKHGWTEVYGNGSPSIPGMNTEEVRSVHVSFSSDELSQRYYGDKAEAIWNYFAAIAFPLMENLTLDNES